MKLSIHTTLHQEVCLFPGMLNNLLLVSLENFVYTGTIDHLCVGLSRYVSVSCQFAKNQASSANICYYDCMGLFVYGCRLVVLVHGFDVGHFWVMRVEKCQNRSSQKLEF